MNCNIGVLSARRLALVLVPALMGHTFVIKAHSGPTSASGLLRRLGLLRVTYIYRDPRDAMLSAYEYGRRSMEKGRPNAFSHLADFQKSLEFIRAYVQIWEKWMAKPDILISRYEDLLMGYEQEAARLAAYLGLDTQKPEVRAVLEHYDPAAAEGQQGLHFYKGKIGRFRQVYSEEQQAILSHTLAPALARMGYQI